jgi:hypothetical protein
MAMINNDDDVMKQQHLMVYMVPVVDPDGTNPNSASFFAAKDLRCKLQDLNC